LKAEASGYKHHEVQIMPLERKRIVNDTKPAIQISPTKRMPITCKIPVTNRQSVPTKKEPGEIERIGVSAEGAAIMLSLSVRSVWSLLKQGKIRHVRYGTRRIISVQSLREYVDGKQEPVAQIQENDELPEKRT
jgi:hypothetical protein